MWYKVKVGFFDLRWTSFAYGFAQPKWHTLRSNFGFIFEKKICSLLSKSWGLFDGNFLKLHRAQVTNFPERNFWVLSIYTSSTTTTIFSDLYLPNGLLLQGIIIWVRFFQRWIILAENPIKKLELFFRPTLVVPSKKNQTWLTTSQRSKKKECWFMISYFGSS